MWRKIKNCYLSSEHELPESPSASECLSDTVIPDLDLASHGWEGVPPPTHQTTEPHIAQEEVI